MKSNKGKPEDYGKKSDFWERDKKKIQSDFLCRPYVIKLLLEVKGKEIADIGCGEGYLSKLLATKGAKVIGIDNSEGLIRAAKKQEEKDNLGIEFSIDFALSLKSIKENSMDAAISVLVFVHFDNKEINKAIKETNKVLKDNEDFILAVPYPFFYICNPKSKWTSCNYNEINYFKDLDADVTLFTKDLASFDVTTKIHTISDYLNSLIKNNFIIDEILEPQPTEEDLKTYSEMWGEETRLPVYLIIKARKINS